MIGRLLRLHQGLGAAAGLALALIALAAAFSFAIVRPLEDSNAALVERLSRQGPQAAPAGPDSAAQKVAAVHRFLDKPEEITDWLAKLHGIGAATGVRLRSASYRTREGEGRIVRFEIVLPVEGSYAQVRDFLKRALAEIPVLSVDQLALKRDNRADGALQAELHLTLHMVKS